MSSSASDKAAAIRAMAQNLLSNQSVKEQAEKGSTEVAVESIGAWGRAFRKTREQHAELGDQAKEECAMLRDQLETHILQPLQLQPHSLKDHSSGLAQQLDALLRTEGEIYDSVDIRAIVGGSDGAGKGTKADTYRSVFPIRARGMLKLTLSKDTTSHWSTAANLKLQMHRLYTAGGKDQKLPVKYTTTVGTGFVSRVVLAGVWGLLKSDRASKLADDNEYLFSKQLSVEKSHVFLVAANPGDRIVCEIELVSGNSIFTAEFLDMKLAEALTNLDEALAAYRSQGMDQIDNIAQKVEHLRACMDDVAKAKQKVETQEAQKKSLQDRIRAVTTAKNAIPDAVQKALAQEDLVQAPLRKKADDAEITLERQKLQTEIDEAVQRTKEAFFDEQQKQASQESHTLAQTRAKQLNDIRAVNAKVMASARERLKKAKTELETLKATKQNESIQHDKDFATAVIQQEGQEANRLRKARRQMKQTSYRRIEDEINSYLDAYRNKLDNAVRERRDAIKEARNLKDQEKVGQLLKEWNHNDAYAKLGPYVAVGALQ